MNYRFAIISGVTLALSTPVFAQDANIDGRVGKLEKEMRAVQRQVFPNGAGKFVEPEIPSQTAPAPTTSSTSATADLTARVDALEAQLATLTGQVELQGNGMRGLEGRLKAIETQMAAQTAQTEAVMPAAAPAAAAVTLPKPKPVVATGICHISSLF